MVYVMETLVKNTYKDGMLHFYFFLDNEGWYVGVCHELGIVCKGKDEELIRYKLFSDAKTFLVKIFEQQLGEDNLNRNVLPLELLKMFVGLEPTAYKMVTMEFKVTSKITV